MLLTRKTAIALALAGLASTASAGLVGTKVGVFYNYLDVYYGGTVIVGDGAEVICPSAFDICNALTAATQTIDIDDNSIAYRFASTTGNPSGFNDVQPSYFVFGNLDGGGDILGFDLSTDIAGLDASRVSFTANILNIDMHGLALGTGAGFTVRLLTASVPEPGGAALALAALAALAAARRKRAEG